MTALTAPVAEPQDTYGPAAGFDTRFELRCPDCGYGIVVRRAPASCPMCHGDVWEYVRAADALLRVPPRRRGSAFAPRAAKHPFR
jgi:hypothetical protein